MAAGAQFEGELAFYPSRQPLRALVKTRSDARPTDATLGPAADATIEAGLRRFAEALAANPWMQRWPLVLAGVRLIQEQQSWLLADVQDTGLPLRPSFARGLQLWRLLSMSGGGAMMVLAEWDGESALPLSAVDAGGFHDLAPRWAA